MIKNRFDAIPQALRDIDRWILWRWVRRGDDFVKVPTRPSLDGNISAFDPAAWLSFAKAVDLLKTAEVNNTWGGGGGIGLTFDADQDDLGQEAHVGLGQRRRVQIQGAIFALLRLDVSPCCAAKAAGIRGLHPFAWDWTDTRGHAQAARRRHASPPARERGRLPGLQRRRAQEPRSWRAVWRRGVLAESRHGARARGQLADQTPACPRA
jgi:hypothetical protein